MSIPDATSPRSSLRGFISRREPAALRVLALLVLLAAGLVGWCIISGFQIRILVSLLVMLTIIALNPLWSLPSAPAYPDPNWERPAAARRRTWLLAALVGVLAFWPRSACMDHSLTNEEVRLINPGNTFRGGHGEKWFSPPEELELPTALEESDPSGEGWVGRMEPRIPGLIKREPYKRSYERSGRLLPLLFGTLTVGMIVLLGASLGSPRAGLAAGLILAMHPQHIHWSSSASGVSTMLFCIVAALLCLIKALRTNQWRWWLTLAAAQIFAQLSHHAALLPLVALNLLAAGAMLRSRASPHDRHSHLFRLSMVLGLTAISLLLLYSLALWRQPSMAPSTLWLMAISGDVAGARDSASVRGVVIWGLMPLCCVAGIYFMFRQDWRTRLFALVLLSAFAITSVVCGEGAVMLAMLLLPLTLAWAGDGATRAFPHYRRLAHAPLILAAIFAVTTAPVLQRTMDLPRQPVREVVKAATSGSDSEESVITFIFGSDAVGANAYDSGASGGLNLSDLSPLVDIAFEKNRPLFVYHSVRDGADDRNGEIMRELKTSGRFHLIREFPAFDPARSYLLYRYQPREQIIRLNVKPEKKE